MSNGSFLELDLMSVKLIGKSSSTVASTFACISGSRGFDFAFRQILKFDLV